MNEKDNLTIQALQWKGDCLKILDQRQLPNVVAYDDYDDAAGVAEAIKSMRVRGAPAIGIAAAYAVCLSVKQLLLSCPNHWRKAVQSDIQLLAESRPTAVNLFWALDKMQRSIEESGSDPLPSLVNLATQIHRDDVAANIIMGELGANLIAGVDGVLTHCNAGALATGGYGTALGVIRCAWTKGLRQVFATETRPWLQGARLTVWELQQDGIAATLIADSAAAYLMRTGQVQWVVVGADRIAANGDVANKIGTYALAVLARQHGVKMMVVAPIATLDWEMQNGERIEIELRSQNELLDPVYQQPDSLVQAWNPVFDVTPAEFITAIVTEKGVVLDPAATGLISLNSKCL